jgi:hypothetical protein
MAKSVGPVGAEVLSLARRLRVAKRHVTKITQSLKTRRATMESVVATIAGGNEGLPILLFIVCKPVGKKRNGVES